MIVRAPAPGSRPAHHAFTLIELLVVISIIALLIGLLLPALSEAKALAVNTKCLANQHQLGIGMASYEGDNSGALPGIQAQGGASVRAIGELGVQYGQPPYSNTPMASGWNESMAPYWGWKGGAMIYGTF